MTPRAFFTAWIICGFGLPSAHAQFSITGWDIGAAGLGPNGYIDFQHSSQSPPASSGMAPTVSSGPISAHVNFDSVSAAASIVASGPSTGYATRLVATSFMVVGDSQAVISLQIGQFATALGDPGGIYNFTSFAVGSSVAGYAPPPNQGDLYALVLDPTGMLAYGSMEQQTGPYDYLSSPNCLGRTSCELITPVNLTINAGQWYWITGLVTTSLSQGSITGNSSAIVNFGTATAASPLDGSALRIIMGDPLIPVPEPSVVWLFGLGLPLAIAISRRRVNWN